MMAGLAMNISDCTAEHSLGQAIGGVKHVPHGLTIGLVLAETLERERAHVPELIERVADAMDEPDDGTRRWRSHRAGGPRLLAELEFPVLSDLGFVETDLDGLADLALADYFITMSPEPLVEGRGGGRVHVSPATGGPGGLTGRPGTRSPGRDPTGHPEGRRAGLTARRMVP